MRGTPEGWRSLDDIPDDGETVTGLLADGRVTVAEWWGPVPEELWDESGDGSGWAWDGTADFISGRLDGELIAWRPLTNSDAVTRRAKPEGQS